MLLYRPVRKTMLPSRTRWFTGRILGPSDVQKPTRPMRAEESRCKHSAGSSATAVSQTVVTGMAPLVIRLVLHHRIFWR
jgi:hypothetical protein